MPRLLSILELQQRFQRSEATLYGWRRRGCPGFAKRDGCTFGDAEAIEAWLKETQQRKPGVKARVTTQPVMETVG